MINQLLSIFSALIVLFFPCLRLETAIGNSDSIKGVYSETVTTQTGHIWDAPMEVCQGERILILFHDNFTPEDVTDDWILHCDSVKN